MARIKPGQAVRDRVALGDGVARTVELIPYTATPIAALCEFPAADLDGVAMIRRRRVLACDLEAAGP